MYWLIGEVMFIYDVCMRYKEDKIGFVVLVGKDYGMGFLCDWVVKGINFFGIRMVIVESFERIYRSNFVFMGVLLFQFK